MLTALDLVVRLGCFGFDFCIRVCAFVGLTRATWARGGVGVVNYFTCGTVFILYYNCMFGQAWVATPLVMTA